MYTDEDEEKVNIDGIYYSKDKTILLEDEYEKSIKNVNIIDGVIEIGDFAFAGSKSLETVK